MKKSKKVLINLAVAGTLASLFLPLIASAQPTIITSTADITKALGNVRNIVWTILAIIVVIMFVWAGITFVTAEGDPGKVQSARNRVLYGIIGIIVALLAGGILLLVQNLMD